MFNVRPFKAAKSLQGSKTMTKKSGRLAKALEYLEAVEKSRNADVVLYNGPISDEGFGAIIQSTSAIEKDRKLLLILATYGGQAEAAYRIGRYCQKNFESFEIFIPNLCKSAGTLVSFGSRRIFMSSLSELGPLDVQLLKQDEIFQRRSGLIGKSAIRSLTEQSFELFEHHLLQIKAKSGGTISFKVASELASEMTQGLLAPVFASVDAYTMGEDYQDLRVATEYAYRLIDHFEKIDPVVVKFIVENYPSHGFVIDVHEAQELFGDVVQLAEPSMLALQASLGALAASPSPSEVQVCRLRDILSMPLEEEGDETERNDQAAGGGSAAASLAGSDRDDRSDHPPTSEEGGGDGAATTNSNTDSPGEAAIDSTGVDTS